MAELLIRMVDNRNLNDPGKDERHCWKRGDVVAVKPDGWRWGKKEVPPRFAIVRIPGVSVEAVKKYRDAWETTSEALVEIEVGEYEAGGYKYPIVGVEGEVTRTFVDGNVTFKRCRVLAPDIERKGGWQIGVDALTAELRGKLETSSLTVGRRTVQRGAEPPDDAEWDTLAERLVEKRTGIDEKTAGVTDSVLWGQ